MYHKFDLRGAVVACLAGLLAAAYTSFAPAADSASIERGRYIITISGCNDCHTPGYMESDGKVDESLWLTGDPIGWLGPWGTTYAPNLRLLMHKLDEEQWLTLARNLKTRPPMPWFNLNQMVDDDLRSIYRYTRHLGPAGQPAPAYLPPGQRPNPPYIELQTGPAS